MKITDIGQPPMRVVMCPYCEEPAVLTTGSEVYRHRPDLHSKNFWLCRLCGAYVGTHEHTDVPLGTLANTELRDLRKRAHALFDPFWKKFSPPSSTHPVYARRQDAYRWLAKELNIPVQECHIAMFDKARCEAALVRLRQEWLKLNWPIPVVERQRAVS